MPTQINTTTRNKVLVISSGLILIGLAIYFITSGKKEEGGVPDVVDFNFHVRPILSVRCFSAMDLMPTKDKPIFVWILKKAPMLP